MQQVRKPEATDVMKLINLAPLLVMLVGACSRSHSPTIQPGVATVGSSAAPQALPTVPPTSATVSVAGFVGKELAVCIDYEDTPERIAQFKETDAGTVLAQTCESLGQAALTTCTKKGRAMHYYNADHSDRYMADCVKSGGVWSRDSSPEAELSRNKQELEKLQGKKP